MTVDGKQTRRKNLTFRPKGENPLHDEAVRVMEQIGRGMCDLVAAAVVYYTYQLSLGNVEPEFAKLLNSHPFRAKVLVVQNPFGKAAPVKESAAGTTRKDSRCNDGMPIEWRPQGGAADKQSGRERFPVQDIEMQPLPDSISPGSQDPLPTGLLESLVLGFGGKV